MSTLEALLARNSHARLIEPGPDSEALDAILRAGLRAPDHGRLRPWHFVLVEGERREILGQAFAKSFGLSNPEATPQELDKARNAPLRAPLIIAGLVKPQEHPKVPRVEQVAAVACALHGMLLAAETLGFGGIWRTGPYARDPLIIRELGGAPADEIVGFLYLGTRHGPAKPLPDEQPADYISHY